MSRGTAPPAGGRYGTARLLAGAGVEGPHVAGGVGLALGVGEAQEDRVLEDGRHRGRPVIHPAHVPFEPRAEVHDPARPNDGSSRPVAGVERDQAAIAADSTTRSAVGPAVGPVGDPAVDPARGRIGLNVIPGP